MSDMLNSFVSKTRIATTTAISLKNNYDTATKTYNSGYYNVYSGYEITMGQVRNTALQRESFICDGSSGQFNNVENQFIDLSNRLACRLTNCTDADIISRSGYSSAPAPCATKGNIYSSDFSMTNTCSRDRYIFAGDYSKNRYEIAPDVVTLLDKDENDVPLAGFIKQGKNSDTDYHFLTKNETSTTGPDITSNYSAYKVSANYRLSPFECETDFDCGLYNQVPRHCDLGKCVNPNDYSDSCTDNANGKVCINGRLRESGIACTTHESCIGKCGTDDGGCVCHAGKCLPGVVNDGDIRQFVSTQRLGTIEYATPVPVEAPFRSYSNTSYQLFSQKYWQRDTMLMAGSNDGMMHAFILGDNGGNGSYTEGIYKADPSIVPEDGNLRTFTEGDELWAFIPKGVMKNLYKLVKYGPQTNINATPIVMDVYDPNSKDVVTYSGDKVNIESTAWKTVMVGGFGNGGIGYYALDITNPGSPKILWEIDNLWQSSANPEYLDMQNTLNVTPGMDLANRAKIQLDKADSTGYPFLLMGKSTAEPVITNMVIDNKIEPVVVLPGGSRSVDMGERAGAALYIVRLFPKSKENLLVKDFYFDNPITGSVAVYPNNFNAVAQHLYFGDSKANLYRIDVSSSNRSEWGSDTHDYVVGNVSAKNITPVFNPSEAAGLGNVTYEAITYKPAVSLYKSDSTKPTIQIIYGTGSNDTFNVNSSDRHYVADFYDYYVSDSSGNGKYQLNDSSASYNPLIYVFNPASNVTTMEKTYTANGYTQKYHVYTQDPISKTKFSSRQKMTGAAITHNFVSYFPTFIANENAEDKCASGHAAIWKIGSPESNTQYAKAGGTVQNPSTFDAFATTSVLELPAGTKIYGLEITNQLYCLKDGKEGSSMAPQLVAQTSTEAPSFNNDTGSAKLKPKSTDINSLAINLDPIQPQSEIISWASVYE
ncbi:MAG: hypothetical protein IJM59_02190 [Proteobacteria bacterium]|nr:hypothetical protein [Pseudomonadota bacterium]